MTLAAAREGPLNPALLLYRFQPSTVEGRASCKVAAERPR